MGAEGFVARATEEAAHLTRGMIVVDGQPLAHLLVVDLADATTPSLNVKEGAVICRRQLVLVLDLPQVVLLVLPHSPPV
jgi:hypothetical protein